MANAYLDSSILDRAIIFAVKAHADTERRGKGFPYIVHPLEAVSIVATMTSDQELLAAAALHDVVEDTAFSMEDIREQFGDRVAELVTSETDNLQGRPWKERKQAAINRIAAATREAKMVAMGDKLSNLKTIYYDYRKLGDKLWSRFHCDDPKEIEWYYRSLGESLSELDGTPAYEEYMHVIDELFGEAEEKPAQLDMSQYEHSGEGFMAESFNCKDGKTMIKLYNSNVPDDIPLRELEVSRKLVKMGLHVPLPGRLVTDGTRVGAEFQRISPKKSFARAIADNPEEIGRYSVEFARMCRTLHSTKCDVGFFKSASGFYRDAVNKSKCCTDAQKKKMLDFLDTVPETYTCVHGDLHIGNVITDGRENWLIDLSEFQYGNPMFDLGMIYLTAKANIDEMTMNLYHINNELMGRFWDIFVEEYFGVHTDAEKEAIGQKIAPFTALRYIHFANIHTLLPHMKDFIDKTIKL